MANLTLIFAFCSSLSVWYLLMSTFFVTPVAGRPGTSSSALRLPPPSALAILADRMKSVEKNLRSAQPTQVPQGRRGNT